MIFHELSPRWTPISPPLRSCYCSALLFSHLLDRGKQGRLSASSLQGTVTNMPDSILRKNSSVIIASAEVNSAAGPLPGPLPLLHSAQQVSMEIDIHGPD